MKDNSRGRIFRFTNDGLSSRRGIHERPDAAIVFKDAATAANFLKLPADHGKKTIEVQLSESQYLGTTYLK